jgi:hypothetical protein
MLNVFQKYSIFRTGARGNPVVELGWPVGVYGRVSQSVTRGCIHYAGNASRIVSDVRS